MNYSYGTNSGNTTIIWYRALYQRKNKFHVFEAKIVVMALFPSKEPLESNPPQMTHTKQTSGDKQKRRMWLQN